MSKNYKIAFKYRLNALKNWFQFKKRMFHLWWANAPKSQIWLEKGNYYIRKGAVVQVGQPIKLKDQFGTRKRYLKNLFFDFKLNKVTASYSDKRIVGYSEAFEKPSYKKSLFPKHPNPPKPPKKKLIEARR